MSTQSHRQLFPQRDLIEHLIYASPVPSAVITRVSRMGMILALLELAVWQKDRYQSHCKFKGSYRREVQAARGHQERLP